MNAKFEKWFNERWGIDCGIGRTSSFETWQAALRSLEVTPELVQVYCAAVNEHLGSLTKKQWLLERADPVGSIERAAMGSCVPGGSA